MKLLIAIESTDYKNVSDRALRWSSMGGYQVRLFVPKAKRSKFKESVEETNYHYYQDIDFETQVIGRTDPISYAKQHDYDLIVLVPEGLMSWRKGAEFTDQELLHYVKAVSTARKQFSLSPGKRIKRFANGAVMKRVKYA